VRRLSPRLRLALGAAVLAAFGTVLSSVARAGEPPRTSPSDVSRLTPDELAAVRARFREWDSLDAATKEKVARNVLRLRALTPEQKALLLARAQKAEAAGRGVLEDLPRRMKSFDGLPPGDRKTFKEGSRVGQAVVGAVAFALSPSTRALLDPAGGALTDAQRGDLAAIVSVRWRRRVLEVLEAAPPLDEEPAASVPEEIATRWQGILERLRRGGAAPQDRRAFAAMVLEQRKRRALAAVPPPSEEPGGPHGAETRAAHEKALAQRLRDAFPEATESISKEVDAAAAGGAEGLLAYVRSHASDLGPVRERGVVDLLAAVEKHREAWKGDATLLAAADAFETALLSSLSRGGEARVTEADVASFAGKPAEARAAFLQELRRRYGVEPRPLGPWTRGGKPPAPPSSGKRPP
jgi:hypothetical protein